ncbi:MAG TPA: head GIN domain-containing protein [Puia sp.]|nr:head GIN domain-containing protein [Puia sp.]
MKNSFLLAALLLTGAAATAQTSKIINDPNAQKRSATGFHAIEVSGGIDLYLSQGGDEAVAVSAADPESRDRIVTVVQGGVLHIYMEDHDFHWRWRNRRLRAYVSCKTLDDLTSSGGSDVYIDDAIRSERLEVHLSGGGDLHGKLQVGDLTVGMSGGADSYVSGTATRLRIHVSGGGDFHGYDLAADSCEAHASGGGDIYVTVNKSLNASVSGGGDIRYKGNATIRDIHTSGGGSIARRD